MKVLSGAETRPRVVNEAIRKLQEDSNRHSTSTPASAAASGVTGTIVWDASYIYVCVAADTWKRVAIATW